MAIKPNETRGRLLISDRNAHAFAYKAPKISGHQYSRGYLKRSYEKHPEGSFAAVSSLPVYPRSEWKDRIERNNKMKLWAKDHKKRAGFKSLDQDGTNYCWINAVISAMHYHRAKMGLQHVELSPASVGALIKNFKNVGGWGTQGLRRVIQDGAAPASLWPANAIQQKYHNTDSKRERMKFRVHEFNELPRRNFDVLASRLIDGFAIPIGLNWWGHEVNAVQLVWDGDFFVDIDNSWSPRWGDDGHALLTESKATPDDACIIRSMYSTAA